MEKTTRQRYEEGMKNWIARRAQLLRHCGKTKWWKNEKRRNGRNDEWSLDRKTYLAVRSLAEDRDSSMQMKQMMHNEKQKEASEWSITRSSTQEFRIIENMKSCRAYYLQITHFLSRNLSSVYIPLAVACSVGIHLIWSRQSARVCRQGDSSHSEYSLRR